MRCNRHVVRVCKGTTRRRPDVTLATDSTTWMRLRAGELSGVDAFRRRLLGVRGNLDHAIAFEGLFRLPGGRPRLLHVEDIPVGRHRISTLTMGPHGGHPVLLVHGLGGTRASMFDTASALSERYRGRIAIEMGLTDPERITGLALLCPAVAWLRRGLHPLVRLLRPEFGRLPHAFGRSIVAAQFWATLHDPDALDPAVGELIVDEFCRIYGSAGARYAFLSSARNIHLDAPFSRHGFYPSDQAPASRSPAAGARSCYALWRAASPSRPRA